MFRLHETTRRRACRTALVLFCAAPTAGTLAWIAWRHRPGMVAAHAERLGDALQVDAHLASWRTPRPGEARCERLKLVDPATGTLLVELDGVTSRRGADGARLTARSGTIHAGGFHAIAQRLPAWQSQLASTFRLEVAQLTIVQPAAGCQLTLHDVQLRVDRGADGSVKAQLAAHLAAAAPTFRVALEQLPGKAGAIVRATLDARTVALPCWLLATLGAPVADLGADATLTGVVQWEFAPQATQGAVEGVVNHVALDALFPAGSPHAVRGQGTVTLNELRWREGRIESLAGAVHASNVEVSGSLVKAAAERLFCVPSGAATAETIVIDRLACRFQLTGQGLTLTGDFGAEMNVPPGCLATSAGQPLLVQPKYVDLPAGAWVQFVAAPGTSWLPATHEAVEIAERLPLPISPRSQ